MKLPTTINIIIILLFGAASAAGGMIAMALIRNESEIKNIRFEFRRIYSISQDSNDPDHYYGKTVRKGFESLHLMDKQYDSAIREELHLLPVDNSGKP